MCTNSIKNQIQNSVDLTFHGSVDKPEHSISIIKFYYSLHHYSLLQKGKTYGHCSNVRYNILNSTLFICHKIKKTINAKSLSQNTTTPVKTNQ